MSVLGQISKSEFVVGSKYRLVRKIGSGSFGDIYLGINTSNGEVSHFVSFSNSNQNPLFTRSQRYPKLCNPKPASPVNFQTSKLLSFSVASLFPPSVSLSFFLSPPLSLSFLFCYPFFIYIFFHQTAHSTRPFEKWKTFHTLLWRIQRFDCFVRPFTVIETFTLNKPDCFLGTIRVLVSATCLRPQIQSVLSEFVTTFVSCPVS